MAGEGEVIFEFRRIGAFAKASAIDVASGVEVSVTAPASADDATLRKAALAKLGWALRRRAGAGPAGGAKPGGDTLA